MKRLRWLFLTSFIILIGLLISAYEPGIPVEELLTKYSYPESEFVEIEELRVHIRKTGVGPTLVLLHGVASSLHTWEAWQEILSDHFQVISIDVPGFGLTGSFPDNHYTVERYMEFLDQLLLKLEIDSCFLAGNSFGGYLGWNYALHAPGKINKLILLDAGGFPKKILENDLGFFLSKYKATAWFTHLFTPRSLVRRSINNAYKKNDKVRDETVERYYELLVRKGNRQSFSRILRMIPQQQANAERLNTLLPPTLIMWGDHDQIIPVRNAAKFKEAIPGSKLIMYDSGHIPMEENPELTANDARSFLSTINN